MILARRYDLYDNFAAALSQMANDGPEAESYRFRAL